MSTSTGVLIVGGGLNGLAAAALLAHHRIDCMVVERHAETSIQYKFTGISPRSMEIFRGLGLEAEIRARRTGDQQSGGIARAKNLADPEVQWSEIGWPDATPYSPTQPATCDQNVLEPILRRHAERHSARPCASTPSSRASNRTNGRSAPGFATGPAEPRRPSSPTI
jgi:putative polyketide hydroxylase